MRVLAAFPGSLSHERHLNAVCGDRSIEGVFKYSHAAGQVLPVGRHSLSVRFYTTDIINYYSADAQVTLTVVKGTYYAPSPSSFFPSSSSFFFLFFFLMVAQGTPRLCGSLLRRWSTSRLSLRST